MVRIQRFELAVDEDADIQVVGEHLERAGVDTFKGISRQSHGFRCVGFIGHRQTLSPKKSEHFRIPMHLNTSRGAQSDVEINRVHHYSEDRI
jgi:hypothetical protein